MNDIHTNPFEAYAFSTDYRRLWELVQTKTILALGDRHRNTIFNSRDAVWIKYNSFYQKVEIISFVAHTRLRNDWLSTNSAKDFVAECSNRNLEWLIPPTKVGSLYITKYLDLDCYTNTEFQQSVDLASGNYTLFTLT